MNSDPLSFRVVVVGDSEAGKTSIIQNYVRNTFEPNQKNTVGAVFHTISREVNGQKVLMQVWDTAGQEKYRSIGPIYYRNACAAIAVFDATVVNFEKSLEEWIVSVKRSTTDPLIFVVGNKVDLLERQDEVANRVGQFAAKLNADAFLTSAKTGENVEGLFNQVLVRLMESCRANIDVAVQEPESETVNNDCC
jgi:small GTP-binding protein